MDYSLLLAIEKVAPLTAADGITPGEQYAGGQQQKSSLGSENKFDFARDISNTMISNDRHAYYSQCGNFIYHLAIIDYLQTFNWEKWSESQFKIHILRRPKYLISAVGPHVYGKRFIKFMKNEVLVDSILNMKAFDYDYDNDLDKDKDFA